MAVFASSSVFHTQSFFPLPFCVVHVLRLRGTRTIGSKYFNYFVFLA
jgi:hypothetical protein